MKLFETPDVAQKRRIGRNLFLVAAGSAMFASGVGMWTFFDDLDKFPWYVILPMFLLFDSAAIACAWMARINRVTYGRMGVEGWLVWLFAVASGLMSASDADGRAAAVRFAAPIVAAILFELLIRGERHDLTNHDGPLARLRRRALAHVGLLDDVDQDDATAATARMAAKLAELAYRLHEPMSPRARRRADRRYHRLRRRASIRMDFANNPDLIALVRTNLDFIYGSISGTSPAAVGDLNVWQSTAPKPRPAPVQLTEYIARPARISAVRRPSRLGRLAGHPRDSKRPTAPTVPVLAPVPAPATGTAALNGQTRPPATTVQIPAAPPPATKPPAKRERKRSDRRSTNDNDMTKAIRFFESERAQGRTPSGSAIGHHIGKSRATGNRILKQLSEVPS